MVKYYDEHTLIDEVIATLLAEKVEEIAIVVDSINAKDIVRGFFENKDSWAFDVQTMCIPYEDCTPVLITLSGDGELWIEEAKVSDSFVLFNSDICYVDVAYYKDVIKVSEAKKYIPITFDEDFEDDEECNEENDDSDDGLKIITNDDGFACGVSLKYDGDHFHINLDYRDCNGLSTAFLSDIIDYYMTLIDRDKKDKR